MIKKSLLITTVFLFCNLFIYSQSNYELLYIQKDFEQILSHAKQKESIDDYFWLSFVLDKQGETLKAINVLEEGIDKFADNYKLELKISSLYYNSGNYPKAKPFLEKYQNNPETFIQLINVLEFQDNSNLAIELLYKKLETDSSNMLYLSHLANNYYQIDSINLALKYYNKVFSKNSADQSTAVILAKIYFKNKDFDKSIKICDTILKSDSTNMKFIKLKGNASLKNKDFEIANNCFKYLYQNGDSSKAVLKHLGISEFYTGKFSNSRVHLLEAFGLDPNDYETCFILGKGYLNSITPEKGLYYFNRVDSLLQPDPVVLSALYYEKQSIYSAIDKHIEALKCLKLAYKYNPKSEYLFYIASMYQNKMQDKQSAYEYYTRFIESLPPKPDSEDKIEENQIVISLKKIAESNILKIKEELFFKGELQNKR